MGRCGSRSDGRTSIAIEVNRSGTRWVRDRFLGGRPDFTDAEGYGGVEEIPGAPFEYLVFVPVPEAKTVKNRIHWDVDVSDVRLLVDHGATVLREPDGDIRWTILADPEGNEFCAFVD